MKLQKSHKPKVLRRVKLRRLRLTEIINRSTILFMAGLAGTAHETLLEHAERPTLIILFAAMMGLPAFLSPTTSGNYGFEHVTDQINLEEESKDELRELEHK